MLERFFGVALAHELAAQGRQADLIVANNVLFEFTAVFHNAMLPEICSHKRVGAISGLGLALGNLAGLIMLLFMLWAFALPGLVDWGFVPSAPLFGLDRSAFQTERISGPITAIWLIAFTLPLLLFTPDRVSSGRCCARTSPCPPPTCAMPG